MAVPTTAGGIAMILTGARAPYPIQGFVFSHCQIVETTLGTFLQPRTGLTRTMSATQQTAYVGNNIGDIIIFDVVSVGKTLSRI